MDKTIRPIVESDLQVVEHEGVLGSESPIIRSKHGSKHMSFNTYEGRATEVVEREDGVGYDPKTGTLYQTKNLRK